MRAIRYLLFLTLCKAQTGGFRYIFLSILTPWLILGIERFCYDQTGGFSLYKVHAHLTKSPEWATEPLSPEGLEQPYRFLGHGNECYAFISKDERYILKLFKHQKWRLSYLRSPLPLEEARMERLHRTFASLKICDNHLREETGLIYLHLNRTTHLCKKITITDKLGIAYEIDLDTTRFALQKRATLLYTALESWMNEGKTSTAKRCLDTLLELIVKRCRYGIVDRDPRLEENFGVIGERAIEIDLGSFSQNPLLATSTAYKRELFLQTRKLQAYLNSHYPPLATHLTERINAYLAQN